MRRLLLIGLALAAVGTSTGCDFLRNAFGVKEGYLFSGFDVLALPGERTTVRVRLQHGAFLRDGTGARVAFLHQGRRLQEVTTDGEGYAAIPFTPPAAGDYVIRAEVVPLDLKGPPPAPIEILVVCRAADAPLLIVDLDKTVVASGFGTVLRGNPQPMLHSAAVLKRLATRFTIVYLSHRIEYLSVKSKAWLAANGFPRGPLLMPDIGDFVKGSEEYKQEALARLRLRFRGRIVGVGDKVSDAVAYHANGAQSVLFIQPDTAKDAGELRDLAAALSTLPEGVQVAARWTEVEATVTGSAKFPAPQARADLLRRAAELDRLKKGGPRP